MSKSVASMLRSMLGGSKGLLLVMETEPSENSFFRLSRSETGSLMKTHGK
jgi:hypothetical protein